MIATKDKHESIFANIALITMSIIILFPILSIVNVALKTKEEFLKYPTHIVQNIHWNNFVVAWVESNMGMYFKNSVIITVSVVAGSCIIAAFAAFPISRRHFKGANFVYLLFMSSLFLPVGLVPLIYIMNTLNFMNTYHGLILLHIGSGLPITIFIFVGFIKGIPRDLDDAAFIDGCGYFRYILQIIIPLMKPAMATVAMLRAIGAWNDFVNAFLFLSDKQKRPLTAGLYMFMGQYSTNWTVMVAGVIIVALPLIITYIYTQKYIIAGVTKGALKG